MADTAIERVFDRDDRDLGLEAIEQTKHFVK